MGELDAAVGSYRRAIEINRNHKEAHYWLAGVFISKGDFDAARQVCLDCLKIDPLCQHALAYSSIAAVGLAKEGAYDFSNMIAKKQINVPDVASFNEMLIADIRAHPSLKWEPYDRVTRGGWVTRDLLTTSTPSIDKLERALRYAIDEYAKSMPIEPGHPFFGAAPTDYRLTLIASILQDGGRHPPHVHEGAWLSGVYYAQVPPTINVDDETHLGWLEFGRPNVHLPAGLDLPISRIAPEVGAIVTFPSYMFHNTVPYLGQGQRIGVAFDVYRAP
jgi:tetratricopeptide (TPR) repeat protein